VEALIKAGAFDAITPERSRLLASVGLAYSYADKQEADANQGGLFDFDDSHAHSAAEPPLEAAPEWSIKERLSLEKTAIGFYLSGHLFDQSAPEVRRIARRQIADLTDSRDPIMVAGIVSDLRVINGNRGRVAIFKLDDKSDAIEAVANEELLNANKDLLAEDELIIVQGKCQNDRFSGGLRLTVTAVWSLAAARARFGKFVRLAPNTPVETAMALVTDWPPQRVDKEEGATLLGLEVRVPIRRERVSCEVELRAASKFWPSDEALQKLAAICPEPPEVVYE
ncbi:MAG TPA: OB-fold nucleic acid binding domain-containing protein, partial [Burkholderiaceae bacterium]